MESEMHMIDDWVSYTIDKMGVESEPDRSKYRLFLEKAGPSVGKLLTLPVEISQPPKFGEEDIKDAVDRMMDGRVRIFADPYGGQSKVRTPKFIMIADGKDSNGIENQLPQLLLVNASMWPDKYSVSSAAGSPIIRNL